MKIGISFYANKYFGILEFLFWKIKQCFLPIEPNKQSFDYDDFVNFVFALFDGNMSWMDSFIIKGGLYCWLHGK